MHPLSGKGWWLMTRRRWSTLLSLSVTCLAGHAETIHLRDRLGSVEADQISFETGGVRVMTVDLTSEPLQPSAESDEPVPPQSADPADFMNFPWRSQTWGPSDLRGI